MREIYTGSQFSRNGFKGNFYWPSQEALNGEKFNFYIPYYALNIDSRKRILISCEVTIDRIYSYPLFQFPPQEKLISEWLYFRTQQDLIEFLELNQIVPVTPR